MAEDVIPDYPQEQLETMVLQRSFVSKPSFGSSRSFPDLFCAAFLFETTFANHQPPALALHSPLERGVVRKISTPWRLVETQWNRPPVQPHIVLALGPELKRVFYSTWTNI